MDNRTGDSPLSQECGGWEALFLFMMSNQPETKRMRYISMAQGLLRDLLVTEPCANDYLILPEI
jgi:hypothetical protein